MPRASRTTLRTALAALAFTAAAAACTADNPQYIPPAAPGPTVVEDLTMTPPDFTLLPDLAPPPDLAMIDWLSDHQWTMGTSGWGPIERDKSNGEQPAGDGKTLTIKGVTYAKGLGCHAAADIRFDLGRKYRTFVTDIGIDDETKGAGSVVFQVFVDGIKLFDSGTVRGNQPARAVNVTIANAAQLRLVVTDSGDGNGSDHADWAGARLVR